MRSGYNIDKLWERERERERMSVIAFEDDSKQLSSLASVAMKKRFSRGFTVGALRVTVDCAEEDDVVEKQVKKFF